MPVRKSRVERHFGCQSRTVAFHEQVCDTPSCLVLGEYSGPSYIHPKLAAGIFKMSDSLLAAHDPWSQRAPGHGEPLMCLPSRTGRAPAVSVASP